MSSSDSGNMPELGSDPEATAVYEAACYARAAAVVEPSLSEEPWAPEPGASAIVTSSPPPPPLPPTPPVGPAPGGPGGPPLAALIPAIRPPVGLASDWGVPDSDESDSGGPEADASAEPAAAAVTSSSAAAAASDSGAATAPARRSRPQTSVPPPDPATAACSCVHRPQVPDDVEWYVTPIWQVTCHLRHLHCGRKPRWPLRRDILCGGTLPELQASRFLSHVLAPAHVAEKKAAAQAWILEHFSEDLAHGFEENDAFTNADGGYCFLHRRVCRPEAEQADLMSAGYPCPPFSKTREKGGDSARTGTADNHPELSTLMDGFPAYLAARRPKCFFLENVVELSTLSPRGSPHTFLMILMRRVSRLGFSCRAVIMDHGVFFAVPRERLFVLGCSDKCGGSDGVEWVKAEVLNVYNLRKLQAPTPLSAVWRPGHPYELQRVHGTKDSL